MEHQPLSRRRLLWGTALSVPLLAACSDDTSRTARSEAASSPAAEVEAAPATPSVAESATTQPQTAAAPQATPVVEAASARPRTIVLDPGHGAEEVGAASAIVGMPNLTEKDSNLAFSWRLRSLLESDGLRVVMTRETDSRAFGYVRPENPSPGPGGLTPARADLQARVDFANQSGADLFLSIHSNDSGSLEENGVEVWYCGDREAGDRNRIWAQFVLENVLDYLRGFGYGAQNRGTKEDRFFRVRNGRNFHLFVLGPPNPDSHHPRATMMPAALVENLFMRHARDQYVLRDPDAREAIAQGMRQAVQQYFEWQGG